MAKMARARATQARNAVSSLDGLANDASVQKMERDA